MDAETMLLAMLEIAERTDGDPETRQTAMQELLKQSGGSEEESPES